MDHLAHLRRDRGCGPWGTFTAPGSPANPALSRSTPGPIGVQDETEAFIAAAAQTVADPLRAVVDAARALAKARTVLAGALERGLENLISTDFGLAMPSLNVFGTLPRYGGFPGWFPVEARTNVLLSVKAWETALDGLGASRHGDGGRTPGLASEIQRAYAVGDRARRLGADFSAIDTSLPAPALVEAFRATALRMACGALRGAAVDYAQDRSMGNAKALADAVAYFNALSSEWRPSNPSRFKPVLEWKDLLASEAPDLYVYTDGGGVVILPQHDH